MRCLKTHVQIIKDDHEMVIFVMIKKNLNGLSKREFIIFVSKDVVQSRSLRSSRLSVCPFLSPFGGSISLVPLVQAFWQLLACILSHQLEELSFLSIVNPIGTPRLLLHGSDGLTCPP